MDERQSGARGAGDIALVGGDLLQLVTAGMHSDPLSIYREYLQNAADSVVGTPNRQQVRVDISLDLSNGRVTIRDDGPGVSPGQVRRSLLPIGRSLKTFGATLGFRGIGRLAGLAFARSVTFSTRDDASTPVTVVNWDGERLRTLIGDGDTADGAIRESVTVERRRDSEAPPRFFEVTIEGISRAASSVILNRERVTSYVAQVCSVPFSEEFPFAGEIERHILGRVRPPVLSVFLDGDTEPIRRPHGKCLAARSGQTDSYGEIEPIHIVALDGAGSEEMMAVGWIAHSSYFGALPGTGQVRGIRVRSGDFQIGDERVFAHLFSEPRFNQWCVAEIHVVDPRLRPNGRRDYFEPSPHLRHLENQMSRVCRTLERRCRGESQRRNGRKRVESVVAGAEEACDLAQLGYLTKQGTASLIGKQRRELERVRGRGPLFNGTAGSELARQVTEIEEKLDRVEQSVEERQWEGMDSAQQEAYRRVFSVIVEITQSPRQAREMIEAILAGGRSQ